MTLIVLCFNTPEGTTSNWDHPWSVKDERSSRARGAGNHRL